jgi:hypothetical protein
MHDRRGWDTDVRRVHQLVRYHTALILNSPSERMKPACEYVAAGVGAGMGAMTSPRMQYVATNLEPPSPLP